MFNIFAIQLPFSVCAVWFVLVLIKGHKTHSDRLMMWVLGLLAIASLCGSSHLSLSPNYNKLVITDIVMVFSTLSVFPVICLYIRSCYEEVKERAVAYLLFLPAILITVSAIIMTAILGISHCAVLLEGTLNSVIILDVLDVYEKAFVVLVSRVYFLVFFVSLSISLIYVFSKLFTGKFKFVHIPSFLRGQKTSFAANILCSLFVIYFLLWGICLLFGTVFMNSLSVWTSIWALLTSFVLFMIGYVAAIPPLPGGYMNIERMRHPFSAMRQSRQEFLQGIDSGPIAASAGVGYDKIMASFKQLMVTEKGFLSPTMTIDEIAAKLNSNRTYVSKLVNIYYGMPFRDYLNTLRMEYAKQLMIDEPDAVIDYIAAKSGFQSSTQFIRKFRETEGVTPSVWRNAQRKH